MDLLKGFVCDDKIMPKIIRLRNLEMDRSNQTFLKLKPEHSVIENIERTPAQRVKKRRE